MTLPVVDVGATDPDRLLATLVAHGAILCVDASVPAATCDAMLRDAAEFFALPAPAKAALAIERSTCFRGYSRMHGERDWREQMHFGPERAAAAAPGEPPFDRLLGPNLWPAGAGWRQRVLAYVAAVERVGARLLGGIAAALGCRAEPWLGAEPYVLTKCIGYHPQPGAAVRLRGVAAHLDFSLLTLTLQDDVGGLETRRPDGSWAPVPTLRGGWLVNMGELLQYVTGNRLVATPHRVVNPSTVRRRVSVPVFVNPSLDTELRCERAPVAWSAPAAEHVHAVLDPAAPPPALHFGRAEWARKGRGVWCRQCVAG
ncbi:MAG: isopenicillin N synthase family oxygenase [Planctomycetes bacterium]|nr:isopenicillin N synthase family oxygenase [Planctomycetota bacterium]